MLYHMTKIVSNEDFRLHLTELATDVRQTGKPIGIHSGTGNPKFELVPEGALSSDRVRSCVRLGPDKFRRYLGDIRALAFLDDIPFGIELRGQLTAVFQRRAGVRPTVAEAFRAEFARRQGDVPPDLLHQLAAVQAAVEKLSARVDDQQALIDVLKRRTQR